MHYEEAIRAPHRAIHAMVLVYFDPESPTTFSGDDIVSLNFLEEATANGDNYFGLISANALDLTFANADNNLTPSNTAGPYAGLIGPGVKIVPFLGVELGEVIQYVRLGTFYADIWAAADGLATVTAYDQLYNLMERRIPNMPAQTNTTLAGQLALLFNLAGITDYSIDADLALPLRLGYFADVTFGEAFRELCAAGKAYMYVDRDNKMVVKPIMFQSEPQRYLDEDQCFSVENPQQARLVFDQADITYNELSLVPEAQEIVRLVDQTITGDVEYKDLRVSGGLLTQITQISSTNGVTVTDVSFGVHGLSFTAHGSGQTCDITVYGRVVEETQLRETVGSGKAIEISNRYIQSKKDAQGYAEALLPYLADPFGELHVMYRGDMALRLYDVVAIQDQINQVGSFVAFPIRHRLTFDTALSGELIARKLSYIGVGRLVNRTGVQAAAEGAKSVTATLISSAGVQAAIVGGVS